MCLILFALDAHPRYPLVIAANRDEFYERPTAPAAWWADAPDVLAGKDLRGGGTWMGIARDGRWAALTNHRSPKREQMNAPTRGDLVSDFLIGRSTPEDYAARIAPVAERYNGFNLLAGSPDQAVWLSNRGVPPLPAAIQPGIHGVSNDLLDTPWPKVERARRGLGDLLREPDLSPDRLLDLLLDRTYAADHDLPETGVGLSLERVLSSMFIVSDGYGTRSSTALLMDAEGRVHFVERTFEAGGEAWSERRFEFLVEAPPGTTLRR